MPRLSNIKTFLSKWLFVTPIISVFLVPRFILYFFNFFQLVFFFFFSAFFPLFESFGRKVSNRTLFITFTTVVRLCSLFGFCFCFLLFCSQPQVNEESREQTWQTDKFLNFFQNRPRRRKQNTNILYYV